MGVGDQSDLVSIEVSSGYGANTKLPYVQLLVHKADWLTQMSTDSARELAHNILLAADAAESDAFLVEFMLQNSDNDVNFAAHVLESFRQYRFMRRTNENI